MRNPIAMGKKMMAKILHWIMVSVVGFDLICSKQVFNNMP
jgi:hypothetical protein